MKLLVVEDSIFVQNVLRKTIVEHVPDCEVITAADGEKGYMMYAEHQPDLITTDLLMPGMSGTEMLRKIRETDQETRVIVISADVQKAAKDEVEALGITGFIHKPVTGDKVGLLIKLIKETGHVK